MKLNPAASCAVAGFIGATTFWLLGASTAGALGFLAFGLLWAAIYLVAGERPS